MYVILSTSAKTSVDKLTKITLQVHKYLYINCTELDACD